jgi:ABC-type amino acid transport substrate-binding protein
MVAGAGLALAQAPPAAAQPAGRSKLDEVRARGKVIVGVTSEAPPFGFIDDKGELASTSTSPRSSPRRRSATTARSSCSSRGSRRAGRTRRTAPSTSASW